MRNKNKSATKVAGETELAALQELRPDQIRELKHSHYCALCCRHWIHDIEHYDCTQRNSADIRWFVAHECPACMVRMTNIYTHYVRKEDN